jgi:hypothetical protein
MNTLETVIIVTVKVNGLPAPIKIASQMEPSMDQIEAMVIDLVEKFQLSGEVQFKKRLEENEQKMYIYEIAGRKCLVLVEKLAKVIEFES